MTPLSVASVLVALYVCYVEGQTELCTTPSGGTGNCLSIQDCPVIMALERKSQRTEEDLNFLNRSHCGNNQQSAQKVCCPVVEDDMDHRCFTPDAQLGTCVSVASCPHLRDLMRPPITSEKMALFQSFRCEGPDQESVCCGPHLTNVTKPSRVCTPSVAPPDPRTECCGLDSSSANRIVGGNETAIDQYPWLTLLEYLIVKYNKTLPMCGGALISSKYVLTAGHCVTEPLLSIGRLVNVRLGEYNTSNEGPDCLEADGGGEECTTGAVTLPIEKIILHRDYKPQSPLKRHDIALLRLKEEAPYNDFIRPICLPTQAQDITSETRLAVAGWGAVDESKFFSNVKLHVVLPYVPLEKCQKSYEVPSRRVKLWEGQVCAGGVQGKDSCMGDSGGPLMTEHGRTYQVVGIVSFGLKSCGTGNVPGVYTKVIEYIPWIRSQIKP